MTGLLSSLRYCTLDYPLKPNYKYPSGLAILPSIAEAAAVAGDERYTFDEREPILPTKFLEEEDIQDRKSTRLNSSHANISYAVFCLKKKNQTSVPKSILSSYHHPLLRVFGFSHYEIS